MTTADDRHNEDVWAEAVAEGAKQPPSRPAAVDDGRAAEGAGDVPVRTTPSTPRTPAGTGGAPKEPVAPSARSSSPADLLGPELTPLVDEVRRFATTLGERVSAASAAASSGDSLGALENLAAPLRSKHPEVYGHLIAAGGELLAAYRSAVAASERRWTAEKQSPSQPIDLD